MKVNAKDESIADDSVMESANEKLESFIVRWFFARKAVEEESERLVKSTGCLCLAPPFVRHVWGTVVLDQTERAHRNSYKMRGIKT